MKFSDLHQVGLVQDRFARVRSEVGRLQKGIASVESDVVYAEEHVAAFVSQLVGVVRSFRRARGKRRQRAEAIVAFTFSV